MTDVLHRLDHALPEVRQWIDNLLLKHTSAARPVCSLGFARLPAYYPTQLLESARVVFSSPLPRPPVAAFDLPEFVPFTELPISGITYRNTFFALQEHATESLCFHELIHVIQWESLGIDAFFLTYAAGILQHGYKASPLEAIAYSAQAHFEAGVPLTTLAEGVKAHAFAERTKVSALYAPYGSTMGP